jgi:hypothetical protein
MKLDSRANKKVLLIELSSHSLVIQPWFDATLDVDKEIVVPSFVWLGMHKSLKDQAITQEPLVFDSLKFSKILLKQISIEYLPIFASSNKSDLVIILTSAAEMRLTPRCYFNMFLVSILGIEITCIRNAGRWKIRNRNISSLLRFSFNPLVSIRAISSELLCYFLEKIILYRSTKLVFESQNQMELFMNEHRKARKKPSLVFCGRQHRKGENRINKVVTNYVGIGLLGTINKDKRNYEEVVSALELLYSQGVSAKAFFLGAHLGDSSQRILDLFGDFVEYAPSYENPFVNENLIEELIEGIDVFLSPMSGSHYLQGGSSGSIADSVHWQRPLLLPERFRSNYLQEKLYFYNSIEHLAEMLKKKESLIYQGENQVETKILRDFLDNPR